MKLKPANRPNRRYILVDSKDKEEVEKEIIKFVGIIGWARADPVLLNSDDGKVIVSINREEIEDIKASFEMSPKDIKIIRVSGTIKGLSK